MGRPSAAAGDRDQYSALAAAAFTASGQSGGIVARRDLHLALWGTFVATTVLERSFDGGTLWLPVFHQNGGAAISFTAPVCTIINCGLEDGVLHRLNCTWTSGTVSYRLSQ